MTPTTSALNYLREHNVMTLATNGPDGLWAAAVFYVNEGFTLYFLSAASSRHAQNMVVQPAAAVTIQEDYRHWPDIRGIQAEGHILRLAGRLQAHAVALYARKFPVILDAPPPLSRALNRVSWYSFTPSRLYYIDNSAGFGHRDEIPLD
jgi:uncharacterized protein YhbP (UPF0306 family)